jgi:hypothetical protein
MQGRNNSIITALVLAGVTAIVTLGCSGALPVWNGTWKLNESNSTIPGPTFVMTQSPAGEYHFDDGAYSYSFRCDGKEHATTPNRTISCLQMSTSVIDTTTKENGVKASTTHLELSADGKMFTTNRTSVLLDGSVKSRKSVYSRTSGSMGFAGGWKDTKHFESIPQMLLALDQQQLHISFSEGGQYIDLPLNGSDVAMHGPSVPQGLTMAVKPHGPREFLTEKKVGGNIINQGFLRLRWTDARWLKNTGVQVNRGRKLDSSTTNNRQKHG